mgnify:CR=1 FL=1
MASPTLNIIGLKESSKHYVPHYYSVANLYKNLRITHVESKSVMHTAEALKGLDFWNLDADVFLVEDSIGYTGLMNCGGNHFDYFADSIKMYRIAHGLFEKDDFGAKWTKNLGHIAEIYMNMVASDIVWVSPVLKRILGRTLPQLLSTERIKDIRNKLMVLPPPDYYKLGDAETVKPKSLAKGLCFLWNHRFTATKRPKAFFGAVSEFHKLRPKVPIEIRICALGTEQEAMAHIPENVRKFVTFRSFIYDKKEYEEFIAPANITLGTSEIESFGVSVFDAIKKGMHYLNLDCNEAFSVIAGDHCTFKEKELPALIARLVDAPDWARKQHQKTLEGLSNLPDLREARLKFKDTLVQAVNYKIETAKGDRSNKVQVALKAMSKKALTKEQVYTAMGWPTPKTCRNAFWQEYYWAMRKRGMVTRVINGMVYYTTEADLFDKVAPSKAGVNSRSTNVGLFS